MAGVLQGAGRVHVAQESIKPSAWGGRKENFYREQKEGGRFIPVCSCLLTAAFSQGKCILHDLPEVCYHKRFKKKKKTFSRKMKCKIKALCCYGCAPNQSRIHRCASLLQVLSPKWC